MNKTLPELLGITPEELKRIEDAKKKPTQRNGVEVKSTVPIKLKDKAGRNELGIDTMEVFGFLPEIIVIEKVQGHNNTVIVSAVVPKKKKKAVEAKKDKE